MRLVIVTAALAALLLPAAANARVPRVRWCGTDEVAADRTPELTFGPRIRLVYAIPADAPDDFAQVAPGIATDAAWIDAWWRSQDPTRTPRFDRYAFPGCDSQFGALDIGFVRLPQTGAAYAATDTANAIWDDLETAFPEDQKTILYYGGPTNDPDLCGIAPVAPSSGGADGISVVFLRAAMECGAVPVGDLSSAETAAHELLHSLGATLPGAPHVCNGGHVCDSASDILYQFLNPGSTLDVVRLDFGRDDYYGHSGSWWDVQDSAWLTRLPTHTFSTTIVGSGTLVARVGSTVLPCENGCTGLTLDAGNGAVVAALPAPGWTIGGWSGSCTGTSPDCVIDGNGDVAATVTFVRASIVVQLHVVGKGRVTSAPAGLSCTSTCRKSFAATTTVRLKATAAAGWKFAGFQGGCTGRTCTIADPVAPVQARFVRTHR